jgi:hypothetical protein
VHLTPVLPPSTPQKAAVDAAKYAMRRLFDRRAGRESDINRDINCCSGRC